MKSRMSGYVTQRREAEDEKSGPSTLGTSWLTGTSYLRLLRLSRSPAALDSTFWIVQQLLSFIICLWLQFKSYFPTHTEIGMIEDARVLLPWQPHDTVSGGDSVYDQDVKVSHWVFWSMGPTGLHNRFARTRKTILKNISFPCWCW